jgi:hypothetical protein
MTILAGRIYSAFKKPSISAKNRGTCCRAATSPRGPGAPADSRASGPTVGSKKTGRRGILTLVLQYTYRLSLFTLWSKDFALAAGSYARFVAPGQQRRYPSFPRLSPTNVMAPWWDNNYSRWSAASLRPRDVRKLMCCQLATSSRFHRSVAGICTGSADLYGWTAVVRIFGTGCCCYRPWDRSVTNW